MLFADFVITSYCWYIKFDMLFFWRALRNNPELWINVDSQHPLENVTIVSITFFPLIFKNMIGQTLGILRPSNVVASNELAMMVIEI